MHTILLTSSQDDWQAALERDGSVIGSLVELGAFVLRRAEKADWLISVVSDLDIRGRIVWHQYPGTFFYFADFGSGWSVFLKVREGGMGCYLELHRDAEVVLIEDRGDILERLMHRVAEGFGIETIEVDLLENPQARQAYEEEQRLIQEFQAVLANHA